MIGDESIVSRSLFFSSPTSTGQVPMFLQAVAASGVGGGGIGQGKALAALRRARMVWVEVNVRMMIAPLLFQFVRRDRGAIQNADARF